MAARTRDRDRDLVDALLDAGLEPSGEAFADGTAFVVDRQENGWTWRLDVQLTRGRRLTLRATGSGPALNPVDWRAPRALHEIVARVMRVADAYDLIVEP